ncbi:hypothetical protein Oter_0147 [Opitutus terrae PB90-1]|uniref:PRC-barrel domain-containing protein n=2 Tax=Opitutus terrae TaxID=107709 RepID=B1ZN69_OPITP|nr:hypothetical protein Oter_0147 [Opitutus terrae PB90-1]
MHGIAKVDQNSIKQQLTATDLIGKDVYDNGGKKVGEVKDLVLGSAAASHLAMAFANTGSSDDTTSSSRSTTGATSGRSSDGTYGSSSTGSATGATGASGTGSTSRIAGTDRTSGTGSTSSTSRTSGSMGSTLGSDVSSAFNSISGMASEPAAIVSLGGFMGMGDNLVRVPLSQLNYDSSKERLTLALSENELSSLTDRSNTRNAAE